MTRSKTAASVTLAFLLLFLVTNRAHAAISMPVGFSLDGLISGLTESFTNALSRFARTWIEESLPGTVTRGVLALIGLIGDFLETQFRGLMGSYDIINRTPDRWTVDNPIVRSMWETSRWVANAALGVIIMRHGFALMSSGTGAVGKAEAKYGINRAVLAVALANFSIVLWKIAISLNNALCAAFRDVSTLPGMEGLDGFDNATISGLMTIVYVIWAFRIFLHMIARIAIVNVGVITSPIAMLLSSVPEGVPYYELWQRFGFGSLFSQVIVVMLLQIGSAFVGASLLPDDSMGPGIAQLLIGLGVLEVALRAPGAIGRMIFGSGGYQSGRGGGGGFGSTMLTVASIVAGAAGVARTAAGRAAVAGATGAASRAAQSGGRRGP
jgi:hypothetical protein